MHLSYNPFKLRKQLYEYLCKYAKQARVMVEMKGNLSSLSKENDRLLAENHELKKRIKEKDERIRQLNDTLNQIDLIRTIEFNALPRKVRREITRGKTK